MCSEIHLLHTHSLTTHTHPYKQIIAIEVWTAICKHLQSECTKRSLQFEKQKKVFRKIVTNKNRHKSNKQSTIQYQTKQIFTSIWNVCDRSNQFGIECEDSECVCVLRYAIFVMCASACVRGSLCNHHQQKPKKKIEKYFHFVLFWIYLFEMRVKRFARIWMCGCCCLPPIS